VNRQTFRRRHAFHALLAEIELPRCGVSSNAGVTFCGIGWVHGYSPLHYPVNPVTPYSLLNRYIGFSFAGSSWVYLRELPGFDVYIVGTFACFLRELSSDGCKPMIRRQK
jgi:hypothetical protein